MIYKAIGLMSGSSLDGLNIAYVHFQETGGKWSFEIIHSICYEYPAEWVEKLRNATTLSALDYLLLHVDYGHYTGKLVNGFIDTFGLHHKVDLVASHGHTSFHIPSKKLTAQLGDGAAIAAVTGLPVIADLRSMDLALGGEGAPIVPAGEKLLFQDYDLLLNLGGIANITFKLSNEYAAFDSCAANCVLNTLAGLAGKAFDENGEMGARGYVNPLLLQELNSIEYYGKPYPKSLSNDFGTDVIIPLILRYNLTVNDSLCTYVEHIAMQVQAAIASVVQAGGGLLAPLRLLVTGGGVFNLFLTERIRSLLEFLNIETIVPDNELVNYKEAVIMALLGVLRWREEYTVFSSVTGATRNTIGGALWLGVDA